MSNIKQNIQQITDEIEEIRKKRLNITTKVQLLAVSKTKPISAISEAIEAGQKIFGENYVQEAVEKIQYFSSRNKDLQWHLIGSIQSNKTRVVAENFDWVHTIDRLKIAQRLSAQRPIEKLPLQVLIQVNTSQELTKSGIIYHDSEECFLEIKKLADEITQLPQLKLRGLMCIPSYENNYQNQLAAFSPLISLFNRLKNNYEHFDTLSMGMSDDMEAAIMSGSTMVRIGSAIFGHRI